MATMSIRGYARSRHADPHAIRRAVQAGIIQLDDDGRVDAEEADRAWASTRRSSRLARHAHNGEGVRSAQAKVALAVARLREARRRFEAQRARYVDRAEAVVVGRAEAEYVISALRDAPDGPHAESFAAELRIPLEDARKILEAFITKALLEVGDLPGQAVRDAERA